MPCRDKNESEEKQQDEKTVEREDTVGDWAAKCGILFAGRTKNKAQAQVQNYDRHIEP